MRYENYFLIGIIVVLGITIIDHYISEIPVFKQGYGHIHAPVIGNGGLGSLVDVSVQVSEGSGLMLVDVSGVNVDIDLQDTIRNAIEAACHIVRKEQKENDFIVSIQSDSDIISGSSFGAAITIAAIESFQNKEFDTSVTITGDVDNYGRIGPVGGLQEKIKAAKDMGYTKILVPAKNYGEFMEESSIDVIRVETIEEALQYFEVER